MQQKKDRTNKSLKYLAAGLAFNYAMAANSLAGISLGQEKTLTDTVSVAALNMPIINQWGDFKLHFDVRVGCTQLLKRNGRSFEKATQDNSITALNLKGIYNYRNEYELKSFCTAMQNRKFYMRTAASIAQLGY